MYVSMDVWEHGCMDVWKYGSMNNHIYSTLFKIQERRADRRSKEIEQRKELQNTHIKQGRTCGLTALILNYLAALMA